MENTFSPKLTFMVPGFSKCGTTMLCALLSEHPDVYMPEIKETNFFLHSDYLQRWHEYQFHFRSVRNEAAVGEGTTMYSAHEHEKEARARILSLYPAIKFIFLARDPRKRIESSYREFHHSGLNFAINTPYGLAKAMNELPALIEDSKYWERINNYRAFVSDDRILVIFLEDLIRDHVAILRQCFTFLGVEPDFAEKISLKTHNSGEEKLYDSPLLRWMRLKPSIGFKIAKLTPEQQNRYLYWLGLRRRFKVPIEWEPEAIARVMDEIGTDAEQFLDYCGKPKDFWEKMSGSFKPERK